MSPEIVLYVVIGTILGVLWGLFTLVGRDELKREARLQSLVELEMEVYKDWEVTFIDGLDGEEVFVPKDMFGRPFPLEDALRNTGSGWAELIRECYQLCVENKVDIHQIKEKFGGLRFYTGHVIGDRAKEFFDAISNITDRSYKVCENCGERGKLDKTGWWKTLCPRCTSVRVEEYNQHITHLWDKVEKLNLDSDNEEELE